MLFLAELEIKKKTSLKKTCNWDYVQLKSKIKKRNIQRYEYPQRLTHWNKNLHSHIFLTEAEICKHISSKFFNKSQWFNKTWPLYVQLKPHSQIQIIFFNKYSKIHIYTTVMCMVSFLKEKAPNSYKSINLKRHFCPFLF